MRALLVLISLSLANQASSQDSDIEALLNGVDTATQPIIEFQDTLHSANAQAQIVIFRRARELKETRPDIFEIALTTALSSKNSVLRSLALWELLSDRANIAIEISDPSKGGYFSERKYAALGGNIGLSLSSSEAKTKTILIAKHPRVQSIDQNANKISVSGETVTINYFFRDFMNGSASLALTDDGRALSGRMRHDVRGTVFNLRARIALY